MGPWRRPGLYTFGTKRSGGTLGTELRRRAGSTPLSVTRINIAVTRSFKTRNPGSAGRGRRVNHAICRSNAVFAEHEPLSHLSGYPPRSTTGTFSSIGCHINRCRAAKLTVTQHDQKRQYRCSQQRRTEIDRLGWWIASPGGNMAPRMKKKRYIFALITILLCHHYAFAADTSVITSVVLYPRQRNHRTHRESCGRHTSAGT